MQKSVSFWLPDVNACFRCVPLRPATVEADEVRKALLSSVEFDTSFASQMGLFEFHGGCSKGSDTRSASRLVEFRLAPGG